MSNLLQLSQAASAALVDAEAHGAKVAAHYLRVQVPELFREITHRKHSCDTCEFLPTPVTPEPPSHIHG